MNAPESGMSVFWVDDAEPVPWLNGRGTTRQLVSLDQHAVPIVVGDGRPHHQRPVSQARVSVATIDRPAPFSKFPGTARSLGVLAGRGMRLTVEGHEHDLVVGDVVAFAGDAVASAEPGGIVRVLNLMQPPRGDLRLRHVRLKRGGVHHATSGITVVIEGSVRVDDTDQRLNPLRAILNAGSTQFVATQDATIFCISAVRRQ